MMFCSIQCNKLLTNSCGLLSTDCISSIPLSCKSLSLKEFLHKQSGNKNFGSRKIHLLIKYTKHFRKQNALMCYARLRHLIGGGGRGGQ